MIATNHPTRMPVMLTREEEWECWLSGSVEEARGLPRFYPADAMIIVQAGPERRDLAMAAQAANAPPGHRACRDRQISA